ncbi:hypothetical protein HF086_000289 [Spodoptera exigua]|uniref:Uncharacterized protein n=1 Tax=Spodoptera exigua TaxID=7107 RepID=A0A922SBS7_SPOEX|nr:hypothetical protein HF086_000289 [Spodoptera exigua]
MGHSKRIVPIPPRPGLMVRPLTNSTAQPPRRNRGDHLFLRDRVVEIGHLECHTFDRPHDLGRVRDSLSQLLRQRGPPWCRLEPRRTQRYEPPVWVLRHVTLPAPSCVGSTLVRAPNRSTDHYPHTVLARSVRASSLARGSEVFDYPVHPPLRGARRHRARLRLGSIG